MSSLCRKNQILVSLLARQQTTPTTPLPLPNPNLRAYGPTARPRAPPPPQMPQPQRHHHSTLSNILTGTNHRANNMNGGGGVSSVGAEGPAVSMGSSSHLQMVLQGGGLAGGARYPAPPPHPLHYSAPAPNPAPAPLYNNQPTSGNTRPQGGSGSGDSEVPSDQTLSDILDEVIDNMPDSDRPPPDVSVRQRQGMKEKNAIQN